jgi:hypothetical protein
MISKQKGNSLMTIQHALARVGLISPYKAKRALKIIEQRKRIERQLDALYLNPCIGNLVRIEKLEAIIAMGRN